MKPQCTCSPVTGCVALTNLGPSGQLAGACTHPTICSALIEHAQHAKHWAKDWGARDMKHVPAFKGHSLVGILGSRQMQTGCVMGARTEQRRLC